MCGVTTVIARRLETAWNMNRKVVCIDGDRGVAARWVSVSEIRELRMDARLGLLK